MFDKTTLLITHYNRSASLAKLLGTLKDQQIFFRQIVVSDDASLPEHQEAIQKLQTLYQFTYVPADKNGGLGKNINKGVQAVTSEYLLYIQEDFYPTDQFLDRLIDAHQILENEIDIDIVRFFSYFKMPFQRTFNEHFSHLDLHFFAPSNKQFHIYSDHPHLRRNSYIKKFGIYPTGLRPDKTEYRMIMKFLQRKGKAIIINDHQSLLKLNNDEEGSTYSTNFWRESNLFIVIWLRNIYRFLKYRYDYLTMTHPYDQSGD